MGYLMGVKVICFDIGWTLFNEDVRLLQTLQWLKQQPAVKAKKLSVKDMQDRYKTCAMNPDPSINSTFIQMLVSFDISYYDAVVLRRNSPWASFEMPMYDGIEDLLQELSMNEFELCVLANQPSSTQELLEDNGILSMFGGVWLSGSVGLKKPDVFFFGMIMELYGCKPCEVAYVGDRVEHDIAPCEKMGMRPVHVRQGPFGNKWMPRNPNILELESVLELSDYV